MEDKKPAKIGLSTFLLFLIIVLIIVFSCIVCTLYNKVLELETTTSNSSTSSSSNTSKKTSTSSLKEILVASEYGDMISRYINHIWAGPEAFLDCIPEFDDIKNAPKEYLATCSAFWVQASIYDGDIYGAKKEFNEFNDALISLFGEKADGLITRSDLEKVFFVTLNPDGKTYSFSGFDGSEGMSIIHIIRNIEQDGDLFYVYQYEYKSEWDAPSVDLEPGDKTTEKIYDRKNNLITTFSCEYKKEGNTYFFDVTDENGNPVDSEQDYVLSNCQDKLSLRKIVLKYDKKNNSFYMISNKLEK